MDRTDVASLRQNYTRDGLTESAADPDPLREAAREGYREVGEDRVLERLHDVEGRGRYQSDAYYSSH